MITVGPNLPSTGASTSRGGFEGVAWTNPGNITLNDGSLATASLSGSDDWSPYLKGTNFGFAIPTDSIIAGIKLEINRKNNGFAAKDDVVKLVKGGTVVGDNKASATSYPASLTVENYGDSTDLWGTTWTYSDVNASDFGAVLSFTQNGFSSSSAAVDSFKITVYYFEPSSGNQGFFF